MSKHAKAHNQLKLTVSMFVLTSDVGSLLRDPESFGANGLYSVTGYVRNNQRLKDTTKVKLDVSFYVGGSLDKANQALSSAKQMFHDVKSRYERLIADAFDSGDKLCQVERSNRFDNFLRDLVANNYCVSPKKIYELYQLVKWSGYNGKGVYKHFIRPLAMIAANENYQLNGGSTSDSVYVWAKEYDPTVEIPYYQKLAQKKLTQKVDKPLDLDWLE